MSSNSHTITTYESLGDVVAASLKSTVDLTFEINQIP